MGPDNPDIEAATNPNVLVVKEKAEQKPEVPWDQWLGQLQDKFKFWRQQEESSGWPPKMPNLPEEHRRVWLEIPSNYPGTIDFVEDNKKLRGIVTENTTGVFYRPGIGYGGVLDEVLDKMGTYGTVVITDPVYEGKEMVGWSEGLLPVDYYVKTLNLIDPQDLKITITDNYNQPGKNIDPDQYETAEIPAGGMATIDFKINGISLTINLLAEDMTKFSPDRFNTLGLGRPTPYNPDKANDPRHNDNFNIRSMRDLAIDGIVDYHDENFSFLPAALPPQAFGFKVLISEDGRKVIQKTENLHKRLEETVKAVQSIQEALGVLSGRLPGENWAGYYKDLNEYREGEPEVTIDSVIQAYRDRLSSIAKFTEDLPKELRDVVLKRIEFLFMHPIATDGQIDKSKVQKINRIGRNPDQNEYYKKDPGEYPYFGSPQGLIKDHNSGEIDILDYYGKVIEGFYEAFPQLKK